MAGDNYEIRPSARTVSILREPRSITPGLNTFELGFLQARSDRENCEHCNHGAPCLGHIAVVPAVFGCGGGGTVGNTNNRASEWLGVATWYGVELGLLRWVRASPGSCQGFQRNVHLAHSTISQHVWAPGQGVRVHWPTPRQS